MAGELEHENGVGFEYGDRIHARDRRQESLILELASLACVEAVRHSFRRGACQAEAARFQGRDLAPYAGREGTRTQDPMGGRVGQARHPGISCRAPPRMRSLAAWQ